MVNQIRVMILELTSKKIFNPIKGKSNLNHFGLSEGDELIISLNDCKTCKSRLKVRIHTIKEQEEELQRIINKEELPIKDGKQ